MRWWLLVSLVGCDGAFTSGEALAPESAASAERSRKDRRLDELADDLAEARAEIAALTAGAAARDAEIAALTASLAHHVDDWQGETTYLRGALAGQQVALEGVAGRVTVIETTWTDGGITANDSWDREVASRVGPAVQPIAERVLALEDWRDRGITDVDDWEPPVAGDLSPINARIDALEARLCELSEVATAADLAVDPSLDAVWAGLDRGTCGTNTGGEPVVPNTR
jgi:hypothetical protein